MRTRNLDIAGPAGRLEAVLMSPEGEPSASAVLCHAHPLHGGTMHFKLLFRVAKLLQSRRYEVLRFQFRGVGRSEGSFDQGTGEANDLRAAIDELSRIAPGRPMIAGGFSFGAAVSMKVGLADPRIAALLAMGLPISAFPAPSPPDAARKPVLLLQGERDEFAGREAIESFAGSIPGPVEIVIVPGADHFFDGALDEVERAIASWLDRERGPAA